jgi:steroid delta-isomerase-like uncharacterized protein
MIRYLRSVVFTLIALSLTLLLMPAGPVVAQDATPGAACVQTTPEENEAIARAYWQEAIWGQQGKIADFVAQDEVHDWGTGVKTTNFDDFMKQWAVFNSAFPDLRFDIDVVAAGGDLVATRWTATGTQEGEFMGIAPTNKEVSWDGINIFRIACGKIAESWGAADHITLLAELGAPDVPALMTGSASAATPMAAGSAATPCASDTPEANLAIAERWETEVWSGQKNLDALDEIADANIVHHGASFPDVHGVAALKQAVNAQFAAFPDIQIHVDDAFADGDLVVTRWSGTGTNQGEFLGLPASGKPVEFKGINVFRIECGKIVESWSEMNNLNLLRQVQGSASGAMATPAA